VQSLDDTSQQVDKGIAGEKNLEVFYLNDREYRER
jgi:hypothetical protein